MEFQILDRIHAEQLLRFERENRQWFESLISPRENSFYTPKGVEDHIANLQSSFRRGNSLSLVLYDGSVIVARANLKNVCHETNEAEVGYRVSERHTGKGIGSSCVGELVRRSIALFDTTKLRAKVLDNNPASKRVLEKHHFEFVEFEPDKFEVNGTLFGCGTFERLSVNEQA